MKRLIKTVTIEMDAPIAYRQETFTRLILRYEDDLVRTARRLCGGNEDRAQDLAQDALLRALRACLNGRFRQDGDARAWLLRIVTNLYINDYRRRQRWEAGAGLESAAAHLKINEVSQRASLTQTPAALLMADTLDEPVERALASLPEKLRRCVVLVDLEGLDYAQAARSLGVPVGTVRSRLSRSRLLLRPLLREYAPARRPIAA